MSSVDVINQAPPLSLNCKCRQHSQVLPAFAQTIWRFSDSAAVQDLAHGQRYDGK